MGKEYENFPFDSSIHNGETDDDDLRIVEQPVASLFFVLCSYGVSSSFSRAVFLLDPLVIASW